MSRAARHAVRRLAIASVALAVLWSGGLVRSASAAGIEPPATEPTAGAAADQAPETAPEVIVHDVWSVVSIGGAPAGWARERRWRAEGVIHTERTSLLRIRRHESTVSIESRSTFAETERGEPLTAELDTRTGAERVRTLWRFTEAGIEERVEQGDRVLERQRDLPDGPWLTPAAVDEYVRRRLAAGATRLEWWTLDPESGTTPAHAVMERTEAADAVPPVQVGGRAVPAGAWSMTSSSLPGVVADRRVADDGSVLVERIPLSIGVLESRRADAETARAAADGAVPEILVATFVRPDRRIPTPRRLRHATYRIRGPWAAEADAPLLPTAGGQRVRREPDGTYRVTVTLDDAGRARGGRPDDRPGAADRAASPMIDADDPEVQRLRDRVLAAVPVARRDDPAARAEALRAGVHRHLTQKDLASVFASASETVRQRSGDCSEHAVLLAALLRADDIPARVAVGLVYTDAFAGARDVFGWHMWTQAWIDGAWEDLDATLLDPFDAAHVLVDVTSLEDASVAGALGTVLQLIGGLEIEVVEMRRGTGRAPDRRSRVRAASDGG